MEHLEFFVTFIQPLHYFNITSIQQGFSYIIQKRAFVLKHNTKGFYYLYFPEIKYTVYLPANSYEMFKEKHNLINVLSKFTYMEIQYSFYETKNSKKSEEYLFPLFVLGDSKKIKVTYCHNNQDLLQLYEKPFYKNLIDEVCFSLPIHFFNIASSTDIEDCINGYIKRNQEDKAKEEQIYRDETLYSYNVPARYYIEDIIEWHYFKKTYNIESDKYIDDIKILVEAENTENYPLIYLPQKLKDQLYKKPNISDLLKAAQRANVIDTPQLPPELPQKPVKRLIPDYYFKEYNHTTGILMYILYIFGCPLVLYLFFGILHFIIALLTTGTFSFLSIKSYFIFFVFSNIIGPMISLFNGEGLSGGIITTEKRKKKIFYPKEEKENIRKVASMQYSKEYQEYEHYKEEYPKLLEEYQKQNCLLNEYSNKIIKAIWHSCFSDVKTLPIPSINPSVGKMERLFYICLLERRPEYVKIDYMFGKFYPDIIILVNDCYIDIEIDEPYIWETNTPTHYKEKLSEEERNKFFTEQGWTVIRFSEDQIKYNLFDCLDLVDRIISFLKTFDTKILLGVKNIIAKISQSRWTEWEAKSMAENNYRKKWYGRNLITWTLTNFIDTYGNIVDVNAKDVNTYNCIFYSSLMKHHFQIKYINHERVPSVEDIISRKDILIVTILPDGGCCICEKKDLHLILRNFL